MLKLTDILHIPLSKQHHQLRFNELLQMGFNHAVLKYCVDISRIDFERHLASYPEVGIAYVELFYLINEYRVGRDRVEGQIYLVIAGLDKNELIFLTIIQNPIICTL